jgi:hypothetical protein
MTKESWSFTVIQRGADYVMEEQVEPTPEGHTLSFVGQEIESDGTRTEAARATALNQLHTELGFRALSKVHLKRPKIVSYHDKTGYFFNLLIPGDEQIKEVGEGKNSRYIIKSFDDVLDALAEQELLELSAQYAEKFLQ